MASSKRADDKKVAGKNGGKEKPKMPPFFEQNGVRMTNPNRLAAEFGVDSKVVAKILDESEGVKPVYEMPLSRGVVRVYDYVQTRKVVQDGLEAAAQKRERERLEKERGAQTAAAGDSDAVLGATPEQVQSIVCEAVARMLKPFGEMIQVASKEAAASRLKSEEAVKSTEGVRSEMVAHLTSINDTLAEMLCIADAVKSLSEGRSDVISRVDAVQKTLNELQMKCGQGQKATIQGQVGGGNEGKGSAGLSIVGNGRSAHGVASANQTVGKAGAGTVIAVAGMVPGWKPRLDAEFKDYDITYIESEDLHKKSCESGLTRFDVIFSQPDLLTETARGVLRKFGPKVRMMRGKGMSSLINEIREHLSTQKSSAA